jgi:anthranilate synthase component 2
MLDANRFYSFVIMRVLLIDNYDSFTFNLVHAIEPLVKELVVWRNDDFNLKDVASFDKIIFSPGPSLPIQSGQLLAVIEKYHAIIPMLGVCLGFQALVEFFNGELINLEPVRHGEMVDIKVVPQFLFTGMNSTQEVGLYHSWGVEAKSLPSCFTILSEDSKGIVMACSHNKFKLTGVQFHPESVMTPNGNEMLKNWINN